MKKLLILAAVLPLSGCNVWTIGEWEQWPSEWDANPEDRVDVVMSPYGDWVSRCHDMGGEPVVIGTNVLRCEGVDF